MRCSAFEGTKLVASGDVGEVAATLKEFVDRHPDASILIFDDATSEPVELDLRGTLDDVRRRLPVVPEPDADRNAPRGPGRPKLGVVAREVTLLPVHWQWLNSQPGGASVALRKLVEDARRVNAAKDRVRTAQEAAYRFMSAMAGNFPGFEEATRALFAGKAARFDESTASWPPDIRHHLQRLTSPALKSPASP